MSFGWTAATWLAVSAGVTAAATLYTGEQSRKAQNRANDQAIANAKSQQLASDEAQNRANAKSPDSSAALTAAMLAGKAGQSGTMLTGPQGIDPNTLTLGKTTLLGG